MFDLLIYDRRQTAKLLSHAGLRLPGIPMESAVLPTSELLVLMQEGRLCTLYLHGASELLPTIVIEERVREFHAPLLIPLNARKLMGGWQGINILHATRVQFKEALRSVKVRINERSEDVAVQVEQR